jgi:hypothetical protein
MIFSGLNTMCKRAMCVFLEWLRVNLIARSTCNAPATSSWAVLATEWKCIIHNGGVLCLSTVQPYKSHMLVVRSRQSADKTGCLRGSRYLSTRINVNEKVYIIPSSIKVHPRTINQVFYPSTIQNRPNKPLSCFEQWFCHRGC